MKSCFLMKTKNHRLLSIRLPSYLRIYVRTFIKAFRSVQHTLKVKEVYVLGTNCADNSPTPRAAKSFLENGVGIQSAQNVLGYEFMQVRISQQYCTIIDGMIQLFKRNIVE